MPAVRLVLVLAVAAVSSVFAAAAHADVIYDYNFDISSNNAVGRASINLQPGHITVTLTNLTVDPKSVAQNISGFWFTLNEPVTGATLDASTGTERTVAGDKTYTDGSEVATGWAFGLSGSTIALSGLGAGSIGPAHTIIGAPADSDLYAAAKGSIAGNGPHNAFLAINAIFEIDAPGLTSDYLINDVQMRFGTSPASDIYSPTHTTTTTIIPEPASMTLFGVAMLLISKRRRPLSAVN